MCARKFKFFFDNVNNTTDTVMVSGISKKEKTLTFTQFIKLYKVCDNLTILAIENQYINSDEIGLKDFPESLKELSLRGTHIYGRQPFLQDANLRLHKLHTLILDDCKWFHEHSLMALSKLVSLENLSLYKCGNLNDSVAYMSITAKFGFRKLLRIDARCTSIGDQFLKCFHCIKTLREIYLEAPQRRERQKKPLFDELRKFCDSQMQETSSAVVFNRSNVFKMRRDRVKLLKKPKTPSTSAQPAASSACPASTVGFSCVDNCENCTIDTCSFIPTYTRTYDTPPGGSSSSSSQNSDPPDTDGEARCRMKYLWDMTVDIPYTQPPSALGAPSSADPQKMTSSAEVFFCDDVSDSEDEMLDFEIFHSDVTDSGVQWFCTSDPHATDNLGHESVLFRKPYKECTCRTKETSHQDSERPGPSGMSFAGPSKRKHPPSAAKEPARAKKVVFRELPTSNESSSSEETPAPGSRRFHNDVTVNVSGQGAVCLKIAYESSDTESESESVPAEVAAPKPAGEQRLPAFDHQSLRGRDLRVIIERLDPGVHIVYDQGGRVQFDNYMKDYTTKLKVFVARGYKLITNHALRSLMDLRLELLDVTGTSVSGRGVKDFLMVNPDCRVIHESTCTCN
ncbi:uncharacterized protein CBL_02134 [Carabus blaptoides fortunei]